jgi:hypothetical protein
MSFGYFFIKKQQFFLFLVMALSPSFIHSSYKQDRNRVEAAINEIGTCNEKGVSPKLSYLVSKLNKDYRHRTPIFLYKPKNQHVWSLLEDLKEDRGIERPISASNKVRGDYPQFPIADTIRKTGNSFVGWFAQNVRFIGYFMGYRSAALEQNEIILPNEVWELILLQTIPEEITTEGEFQRSLKTLYSLAATNKTINENLASPFLKKIIVSRMFNSLTSEAFNALMTDSIHKSLSKASTSNATVLKVIKDALLDIRTLRLKNIREYDPEYNNKKLKKKEHALLNLANAGFDPNLFIKKRNNLFHCALKANLPEVVAVLIEKGADVNMKTFNKLNKKVYRDNDKKWVKKLNKERRVILESVYDQIPFVLAFQYSSQSALILLRNEKIDIDAIKMKLSEAQLYPTNTEDAEVIHELVKKGIDPNTEVWVDISYLRKSSLFGCVATIIWKHALKMNKTEKENHMVKYQGIVKFLLAQGALLDKRFDTQHAHRMAPIRTHIGHLPAFKEIFEEHERTLKSH